MPQYARLLHVLSAERGPRFLYVHTVNPLEISLLLPNVSKHVPTCSESIA
jgi:hypothetical protein